MNGIMVTATRDVHIKSIGSSFLIKWKISKFSMQKNQFQSDFFVLEDIKVHFVLFFKEDDESKSYIQTTIYGLTSEICPKFEFEIKNHQDNTKNINDSHKAIFSSESNRHTFSLPISRKDLNSESSGYILNSEITIDCRVFYKASLKCAIKMNESPLPVKKRRLSSDFIFSSTSQLQTKVPLIRSKDDDSVIERSSASTNSKSTTGYVGLQNQGATCYMNSMLESLFHTPAFRRLVFKIPTTGKEDATKSITLNLQRLFCRLQVSEHACPTTALTRSFGWTSAETFMQHDVQEFCRVLMNNLEEKLKNTELSESIPDLFRGETCNYIRCINVDYESSRKEFFYDLSLTIKGFKSLEESFEGYVAKERLDGSNQYSAGDFGKQDADMGIEFLQLPKVLHLHLRRFDFDYTTLRMEKVNDRFEFPKELDLKRFVINPKKENYLYDLYGILVHSGGVYGGHYYAFLRTSTSPQWFKFNDSCVTKEEEKNAIEDNFGGSGKLFSAYMLVYVDRDFAEEIFRPVEDSEIPRHLKDYVVKAEEEEKLEKEQRIKQANTIFVSSLNEDVVELNCLTGKYGFKPLVEDANMPLQKSTTVDVLYEKLAEKYNKKSSQIRVWMTDFKRNPIQLILPNKEVNLAAINNTSTQNLDFFVQFKNEEEPVEIGNDSIMVYVKFFFPKEEAPFQYLGHFIVSKNRSIKKELFARICGFLGCPEFYSPEPEPEEAKEETKEETITETETANQSDSLVPPPPPPPPPPLAPPPPPPPPSSPQSATKGDTEKMFVYLEASSSCPKKLNVNKPFFDQGVGNGAILIFQISPNVTDVPTFPNVTIKKPLDANQIIKEKTKEKEEKNAENDAKKEAPSNIASKVKNLAALLNADAKPTESKNENEEKSDNSVPTVDFMKYSSGFSFDTVDTYINIFSNITDIDVFDLEHAEKPLFMLHISTYLPFDQIKRIIAKEANLDYDPERDSIILYKGTSPDKLPTNPMDSKMYQNPRSYFMNSPSTFKLKRHRLYFHMNHKMSESVAANSSQFTVQFASDGYNVDSEEKVISEKKSTCIKILKKSTSNLKNFDVENLRFMSIYDHKISSVLAPDQEFIWSYCALRIDVVPDDQKVVEDGNFLLKVAHGYTDVAFYTHPKDNPLFFKVIKDEPFKDAKKRLLKLLKWDDEKIEGFNGQFKLNVDTKVLSKEVAVNDDDCLSKIASGNSLLYIIAKEDMNVRTYNVGSRVTPTSLKIYN